LVAQQPQQRLVQPHELGALAAFLCHDDALGITMEDIQVNAGNQW
jgi:NAD(P)-dependent dehydrogenase (short-subunit alcohol dehydrogenase family)